MALDNAKVLQVGDGVTDVNSRPITGPLSRGLSSADFGRPQKAIAATPYLRLVVPKQRDWTLL